MRAKIRAGWFLVGLSMLCELPCLAQQNALGMQAFGSFSGGPDLINLGNLNVHLNIPVLHKQGRGIPFIFDLTYDSAAVWSPVTSGGVTTWTPNKPGWGWPASKSAVGYIPGAVTSQITTTCKPSPVHTYITTTHRAYPGYTDIHGSLHHAPALYTVTITGDTSCGGGTGTNGLATTDDGSGYTISISYGTNVSTATITTKGGAKFTAPIGGGTATVANDANGNEITFTTSSGQFFDTLSATTPVLTVTGIIPSPVSYTYTPPSGTPVAVVVSYKSYPVQTHFQCSGTTPVTDYGVSSPINNNLVDKVTLPDGSFYQLGYEPTTTGSPNVTGRIASITLPTGGTISYAYTGSNGGINCADGSTMGFNRTTPDSATAWQYSRSGSNPNWTTTVTDPLGNSTTYTMYEVVSTTTSGSATQSTYTYYETNRVVGTSETITTCYNGTYASCPSATVALPIFQLDRYRTLGSKTALSEAIYDTSNNNAYGGRLKEQKVYDFGVNTGSAPSSTYLLTDTVITYATITGIIDHPYQITVKDGSGNIKSQTTYAYTDTVTSTSNTPQHGSPPNGSRGNLASVSMLTTGTSTLTKSFSYFDTGNVYVATDVNSATTTYTYGACGNSFPTQVAFSPVVLSESMVWNCTGGVLTSYTDPNSNVSTTSYTTDPYFWRPEYATDLAGNKTNFTYPSLIQAEGNLTFNGNTSETDNRIQLDNLGRILVSQTQQAPSGQYDSVQTGYDALGRVSSSSLPYSAAAGGLCSGSCPGVTMAYDALGRVQTVSDSGGGSMTYTYPGNDIYQSLGPPPAGENKKDKQLEYDGAGRLTSVCEVLATGGSSCNQTGSASGYKTSYAYSVISAGQSQITVTQGTQTRTYVYDGLNRLISESNPESQPTTYIYDAFPPGTWCGATSFPGDLVLATKPDGTWVCYFHDALHRLTDVGNYYGSVQSPDKRFRYDNNSAYGKPPGVTVNNTLGRLAEVATDAVVNGVDTLITDEWFSYDADGRVTDVYQSTPNSGGYYHTTAGYYANGALSSLGGVPTLSTWAYGVDGEGRPYSATYGTTNWVKSATYPPSNASNPPQTAVTYGIGSTPDSDVYTYDATTWRMNQFKFTVGSTPKTLTGAVGWNANGTLGSLGITDQFNASNTQNCSNVYDDLGRASSVNCTNGSTNVWNQSFTLDQYGNISKSGTSSFSASYLLTNGTTNNQEQSVASCVPTYDANGNLTKDCSFVTPYTYTWNVYGQPASLNGVNLTYDAFGREVEIAGSPYSQILYGPIGKLGVMNGQTPVVTRFPLPGGSTAEITGTNGSDYTLHSDWLGSSRLASSLSGRAMIYDGAYAPFGENYTGSGSPGHSLDFTGQNQDTLSGIYDFVYRAYNPVQGRWISPDPAGLGAVDPGNPQSWNRYSYVANNPTSFSDPSGLVSMPNVGTYASTGGGSYDAWATSFLSMMLSSGAATQCINNYCGAIPVSPTGNFGGGFVLPSYGADGSIGYSLSFSGGWNGIALSNAAIVEALGLPTADGSGDGTGGGPSAANNSSKQPYLSVTSDTCSSATGRDIQYQLNGAKGYVWEILTYSNGSVANNTQSATLNGYPDFISIWGTQSPISQRFVMSNGFPTSGAQGAALQIQQNIGGWNVMLDSQIIQRTNDNIYVASKPCPK